MFAMGFAEILMLALLSGGASSTDVVSLIQPTHYFQTRQIEVSIDKMLDYASEDPKDAKTQIVQLTALRYLADEADALKKSPKYVAHRQTLEAIATGKKAQDALGFAKDYASRVLHKLDNTKAAPIMSRPVRDDALSWFPATVTMAGALDLQQSRPAGIANDPLKEIIKMIPDRERKQMYEIFEQSGNVRIERIAFGYVDTPGKREEQKVFLRFTGKGNPAWMVETFKMMGAKREVKQLKGDKDTPILLLQEPNRPAMVMMVGNTDLLVFGYKGNNGKNEDLLDEVLDARSKKKPNAATGTLKDNLAKVPDKAVALVVGNVPEDMKREFRFIFDPVPTNITAFIERAQQGMDVQVETNMANAEDAGKLVKKVASLRKEGIAALKQQMQQPQPPGTPPIPFQALVNVLETLQVQSKADQVRSRVFVPDGLIEQMANGWMLFGMAGAAPPPPVKKN
jgi:hypothetical protein